MAQMALSLNAGPVVVVVGANDPLIRAEIAELPVQISQNDQWQTGMASSLRAGMTALSDEPIDAFLVLLTDQPYVTPDLLQQLIDTYRDRESGRGITACQYGEPDFVGVPALFDAGYIPEFLNLTGDMGARKLIRQYADDCVIVPFPLGSVDLDTPADVANWQNG